MQNTHKSKIKIGYLKNRAVPPLVNILHKIIENKLPDYENFELYEIDSIFNLNIDFFVLSIGNLTDLRIIQDLEKILIRTDSKYLFVDHSHEGPALNEATLEGFHSLNSLAKQISAGTRTIYVSSNQRINEQIDKATEIPKNFEVLNLNYWILDSVLENKQVNNKPELEMRRFLSLNYWPRTHRLMLAILIYEKSLQNKFYVSFPGRMIPESQIDFLEDAKFHAHHYGYSPEMLENLFTKLESTLPWKLDLDNISKSDNLTNMESINSANRFRDASYIEIVTETEFDEGLGELRITEKTLKPIISGKPFIILGPANILKLIKQMGFETFDSIWSENYDRIGTVSNRFRLATDQILYLANLNDRTFKRKLRKANKIAQRNRELICSLEFAHKNYSQFLDALFKLYK